MQYALHDVEHTLARHAQARIAEFSAIPPFLPHSCVYCSQLLVKFSEATAEKDVEFPIDGLTQKLFQSASRSDCVLFGFASPEDYDGLFEEKQNAIYTHHKVSNTGTVVERNFMLRVKRVHSDGMKLMRANPVPWLYNDQNGPHFPFKELDLYLEQGSPLLEWIYGRWVGSTSAATDDSFRQAKIWLQECLGSTHHACVPPPETFVPSRLLEIPALDSAQNLRVVETRGVYKPWCALSYCWGGPQLIQTTTTNFQNGSRTIPLSILPMTIMDAVLVCRRLGINSLWVDSLCILQDSPDDLSRELVGMPKIYKHAMLTVSAAVAATCTEGFLGPRIPQIKFGVGYPVRLRCQDEEGQAGSIILARTFGAGEPIHTRAWTMQEHLLSTRILIYSSSTLKWLCKTRQYSDSYNLASRDNPLVSDFFYKFAQSLYSPHPDEEDVTSLWFDVVGHYNPRGIAFQTDKLIALSAVAREIGEIMHWDYAAGLWKQRVQSMLGWYFRSYEDRKRPARYRAPSWSWASVSEWRFLHMPKRHEHGRVFTSSVNVIVENEIPYGDAKFGQITTECVSVVGFLSRNVVDPTVLEMSVSGIFNAPGKERLCVHLDAPSDDFKSWDANIGWEVHLLPFCPLSKASPYFTLIVVELGGGTQRYQRVGMLEIKALDYIEMFYIAFKDQRPKEFVIV